MVRKRGANQHTGQPFAEWCEANGERGERLLGEFCDPDTPAASVARASKYRALWTCAECAHVWCAKMSDRTKRDKPTGCPKCAGNLPLSATYNFLAWCEANGARGAKLLGEYVDPFWPPTAFTKGSKRKARWKCETCAHAWNAMVFSRTRDKNPTGCPACNPALGKRKRDDA